MANGVEAAAEDALSVVRAAGGIVVRDGRVLLVHRPKYDDWTLPKGKAEADEPDEDCALREVHEETGLECELGRELGVTKYVDSRGRPKRVRWWLMRPLAGEFVPGSEVDEIRWLDAEAAREQLSYDRDVELLERL
ncbi:MAG TPA: NUDIX hydrolase [Gaiellaceae bacterium]|nr:NUDIX hydrolase [Gaiellaceae bacterium]HEV8178852.1 NUDIX hydrolase [Gaiellaceae bacterium]